MEPKFHDYLDEAYRNCSKVGSVPAATVINMDSCSEPQAFNCPSTAHAKVVKLANVNHVLTQLSRGVSWSVKGPEGMVAGWLGGVTFPLHRRTLNINSSYYVHPPRCAEFLPRVLHSKLSPPLSP